MECIVIIPARGGSKGIPRKNVLPLAGKPLIVHNIQQAQLARKVSRVVVSTDDPEIAATAKAAGAGVVWRPIEISGDTASSESALLHVLESLRQTENYQPDQVVFLQCTSPLTLAEDIDGTIQTLEDQAADTALAVIPFHYFLWRLDPGDANGHNASGINHDKSVRPLRQERETQYLETGAVYVMKTAGFIAARHRFFGKTAIYVMPSERRLEIDEPVDFLVAEVLMRAQNEKNRLSALPKPVSALVLDFDGVFTDNRVIVFQDGSEAVICDRGDGWGISQLKKTGLSILILSTENNPVVQARANKLGIPCVHGVQEKGRALQAWLSSKKLDPAQTVYVGNDLNDLPCLAIVGCPVAVADAHPQVIQQAALVLENAGGEGALREICDLILQQTLREKH